MEVPAYAVQSTHVIRAVQADHCAADVLIIELRLVLGQRLVQHAIGLFLLILAAHLDRFKRALDLHHVEAVRAELAHNAVHRLLQRRHVRNAAERERLIHIKERHVAEGHGLLVGGNGNAAVRNCLVDDAVQHNHLAIDTFEGTDACVAVLLQLAHGDDAVIVTLNQGLQQRYLVERVARRILLHPVLTLCHDVFLRFHYAADAERFIGRPLVRRELDKSRSMLSALIRVGPDELAVRIGVLLGNRAFVSDLHRFIIVKDAPDRARSNDVS